MISPYISNAVDTVSWNRKSHYQLYWFCIWRRDAAVASRPDASNFVSYIFNMTACFRLNNKCTSTLIKFPNLSTLVAIILGTRVVCRTHFFYVIILDNSWKPKSAFLIPTNWFSFTKQALYVLRKLINILDCHM